MQQNQDSIVRRNEKWSFLVINSANFSTMTLINFFLLKFYTEVAGINPAVVRTLFLVSKIFNGFNDPIMGYVVDHLLCTKMGRFRSLVEFSSPSRKN